MFIKTNLTYIRQNKNSKYEDVRKKPLQTVRPSHLRKSFRSGFKVLLFRRKDSCSLRPNWAGVNAGVRNVCKNNRLDCTSRLLVTRQQPRHHRLSAPCRVYEFITDEGWTLKCKYPRRQTRVGYRNCVLRLFPAGPRFAVS